MNDTVILLTNRWICCKIDNGIDYGESIRLVNIGGNRNEEF